MHRLISFPDEHWPEIACDPDSGRYHTVRETVYPGSFTGVAIVVLPFLTPGSDVRDEALADGLGDTLITSLAKLDGLRVVSATTSQTYRERTLTVPEVGRELGVDAVVEGSLQREGDRIVLNAQLIDARSDTHRCDEGGLVVALDASSGRRLWSWRGGDGVTGIAAADQVVVTSGFAGDVAALDAVDGALLWTTEAAPWIRLTQSPALGRRGRLWSIDLAAADFRHRRQSGNQR